MDFLDFTKVRHQYIALLTEPQNQPCVFNSNSSCTNSRFHFYKLSSFHEFYKKRHDLPRDIKRNRTYNKNNCTRNISSLSASNASLADTKESQYFNYLMGF